MNKQLKNMKKSSFLLPREEKICETIAKSKDVYFQQEPLMTWWEFLWTQLCYTRKRWWGLQAALLALAWQILPAIPGHFYQIRSVGVFGCLFVVLMVPELWRNKSSDSVQVEAACLYSLRQIYAARTTLFGLVDIFLLSLFSISLDRMGFSQTEVVSLFLLPATVTACICFSMLCGKRNWGETVSVFACLAWCAVWWLILMNEALYLRILPSVWMALFAAALGFLLLTVRAAVCTTNQYWEVTFS